MTTIQDMAKSGKPKSEKSAASPGAQENGGTKKRIGVNFSTEWHAAIRKLAGKRKMPVLWYLIELAREDAEKQGVQVPPLPWEEEGAEEGG